MIWFQFHVMLIIYHNIYPGGTYSLTVYEDAPPIMVVYQPQFRKDGCILSRISLRDGYIFEKKIGEN